MNNRHTTTAEEVIWLLEGGHAHATLDQALAGIAEKYRGMKPHNLPYSIWQLVEHIRMSQSDMIQFCVDENYVEPDWPQGYWPDEAEPSDEIAWNNAIDQIEHDRNQMIHLLHKKDIYEPVPNGDGQSILREALQIADHNAYHIAEIIVLRRLLGIWNK